jgi:hypothetical protein
MHRYIITPLLLCCLIAHAAADDIQLQKNHPDRHVVVKGDTLWGISGKFLKNPWQWPKIWNMNRAQIKNPHWIYPGDVIVLDMSSGQPQLRLLSETVTLRPGIRVEALDKAAIPSISPDIIAPFLTQPLVIEQDELKDAPSIIAGPDNRVVLAPGTKIYINRINNGDGLLWHIYRPGKALIDPDTKASLGTEAIYLGDAEISKYGAPATGQVISAKEEIFAKDNLVAASDTIPASFIPHAPDSEISGRVLSIYGGLAETGSNSIVTINRGVNDGVEVGHVFAINRAGKLVQNPNAPKSKGFWAKFRETRSESKLRFDDGSKTTKEPKTEDADNTKFIKLPDERVGLLMVFRTFKQVSYALVMQASEPINVSDVIETP